MLSWSNRPGDEPGDHPDHPLIFTDITPDPDNPGIYTVRGRLVGRRLRFAPVEEQEPDVIEPTALFEPWEPK